LRGERIENEDEHEDEEEGTLNFELST